MATCALYVYGTKAEICDYLSEWLSESRHELPKIGKFGEQWNFSIPVEEMRIASFDEQAINARRLLEEYRPELERLAQYPGLTNRRLTFGLQFTRDGFEANCLPPELLVQVGELGIGVVSCTTL
ncbi:hypothetical protein ACXR0O_23530 [Verrucomicrobiota bacterium sgz303538]